MAYKFEISGMKSLQKTLKEKPAQMIKEMESAINIMAMEINAEQTTLAPINIGGLRFGIGFEKDKKSTFLQYNLFSRAPYSAYIEFGTRKKFKAIPGVDASVYQGNSSPVAGGSLYDSILEWVKLKNIGDPKDYKSTAYLIARKIYTEGVNPQPFFFTPFLKKKEQLRKQLELIANKW
jgi:hypothetical protein